MTKEDIDRIASEYFNDKESEHEMDEVFDLAKKALEERKEDMLDKIKAEIEQIANEEQKYDQKWARGLQYSLCIIDKYREEQTDAT